MQKAHAATAGAFCYYRASVAMGGVKHLQRGNEIAAVNWIPDGYTVVGYVEPNKDQNGLFAPSRFKYRPGLAEANGYVLESGISPGERERRYREFLHEHLIEWDLKNPLTGHAIDLTPANIGRVNPVLRGEVSSVVMGIRKSDPLPETGAIPERPNPVTNAGN